MEQHVTGHEAHEVAAGPAPADQAEVTDLPDGSRVHYSGVAKLYTDPDTGQRYIENTDGWVMWLLPGTQITSAD